MSHNPNETTEHIVSNMINWSDKVIKSQHELNTCNDGKRSSDVVLSAIEKAERLQKQLDIALDCMRVIKRNSSYRDIRHSLIVVAEHKIKELDNDNQAK